MMRYLSVFLLGTLLAIPSFGDGRSADVLPYVSSNSVVGFEYGLFGNTKNILTKNESFMLILYKNEKGGGYVDFLTSFPDKKIRYGSPFPLAVDLEINPGKAIAERFYGIGSDTPASNYSYYDRRYNLLKIYLSRALTNNLVLGSGYYYSDNDFSNISQGTNPITLQLQEASRRYGYIEVGIKINHLDNPLHPSKGEDVSGSLDFGLSPAEFTKMKFDYRKFGCPFHPDQILAGRLALAEITGSNIPLLEYASLGGRDNLRGYPTYRFWGRASALLNFEYRFPLFWQFGGVLFVDTGKVFDGLDKISFEKWPIDIGLGIRYYLSNLVIRFDYGIGQEGKNYYFYYNHVF